METNNSQFFLDYISADVLIQKFKIQQRDLVIRAMRKQIKFYYPVKSEKNLTYYPVSSFLNPVKKYAMLLGYFLLPFLGRDHRSYTTGDIVPVKGFTCFNSLGTNTLNESIVLGYCRDTDKVILGHERLRNKFHPINFKDILVSIEDAQDLKQIMLDEMAEMEKELESLEQDALVTPKTKQAKREEIFLTWLQGKDELQVSNMKKEEVWEQLRMIDQRLFSVEPKNFFRDQKIITFKSGRKAI